MIENLVSNAMDDLLDDEFVRESILVGVPLLLKHFPPIALKSPEVKLAFSILNKFKDSHPIVDFSIPGSYQDFSLKVVHKPDVAKKEELKRLDKNLEIQTAKLLVSFFQMPLVAIEGNTIHTSWVEMCQNVHKDLIEKADKEVSLHAHLRTSQSISSQSKKLNDLDLEKLYNYLNTASAPFSSLSWLDNAQAQLLNIKKAQSDRKRFLSLNGIHVYQDSWWLSQALRFTNNFINYLEMNLFFDSATLTKKNEFISWQKTIPSLVELLNKKDHMNTHEATSVEVRANTAISADFVQSLLNKKSSTFYIDSFLPLSLNKRKEVYKNERAQSLLDTSCALLISFYNAPLMSIAPSTWSPQALGVAQAYKDSFKYLENICKKIEIFYEPSFKNKEILSYKSYEPYVQTPSKNLCIITQILKDNEGLSRLPPKDNKLAYICEQFSQINELGVEERDEIYQSTVPCAKNALERQEELEQKLLYLEKTFNLYFSKSKNLFLHHSSQTNKLFHSPITFLFRDFLQRPVKRVRKVQPAVIINNGVLAPAPPFPVETFSSISYKPTSSPAEWDKLGKALERSYTIYKMMLPLKKVDESYKYDLFFHLNQYLSLSAFKPDSMPMIENVIRQFVIVIKNIYSNEEAQEFLIKFKHSKEKELLSLNSGYRPEITDKNTEIYNMMLSIVEQEMLKLSVPVLESKTDLNLKAVKIKI